MSDHPLFRLIDKGDYRAVPDALAAMTADERRAAVPELKAARASLSRSTLQTYDDPRRIAVLLAGAGCLTTAPAVADWLLKGKARVPSIPGWRPDRTLLAGLFADGPDTRDTGFQAELVRRIADSRLENGELPYYHLAVKLIRRSGCPVPTTRAFTVTWVGKIATDGRPLAVVLAEDPFTKPLLHRLFEIDGVSDFPQGSWYPPDDPERSWPLALAKLADDGVVDAGHLHEMLLASLVRGTGAAGDIRFRLRTLERLAPSTRECARYENDYVRLLLDGPSTVVAHAQRVLSELLAPARVIDVSRDVLLRSEKKLVRTQLSWLDSAARQDPATADAAITVLTEVRDTLEDAALRERVERLITRHSPRGARPLPSAPRPEPEADISPPPPPEAVRLDRSRDDTPEDAAAALNAWWRRQDDPGFTEAVLDRLTRHAHQDRPGLAAALRGANAPLLEWFAEVDHDPENPLAVAAAVCGIPYPGRRVWRSVLQVRSMELAHRMRAGIPTPLLLATATHDDGTIEVAELVARIAEYERWEAEPGQVDLAQALLRVAPEADPDTRADAEALTSAAGRCLVDRLRTGGRDTDPAAYPEPFASLLAGPEIARWTDHSIPEELPYDPEIQARWIGHLRHQDGHGSLGRTVERLAAMPGPKGEAMHRALAAGLNHSRRDDRAASVDALVVMVSRAELDPAQLAAALDTLPAPMASRLSPALADAAAAVGARRVWPVLSGLLARWLPSDTRIHGLGDLLATATNLATRAGAHGDIPGLTDLASRPPKSRLVQEARRLRDALTG